MSQHSTKVLSYCKNITILLLMVAFTTLEAICLDNPADDIVSRYVKDWQEAENRKDINKLLAIYTQMHIIRGRDKERFQEMANNGKLLMLRKTIKIVEQGVVDSKRYAYIQVITPGSDAMPITCHYVIYDSNGVIGGFESLEMYRGEKELKELSQAMVASVYFKDTYSKETRFQEICTLDESEMKEAISATQYEGASGMSPCCSSCPFTMMIQYKTRDKAISVIYGTDGCNQFYFTSWSFQGTALYSPVLKNLIAIYNSWAKVHEIERNA